MFRSMLLQLMYTTRKYIDRIIVREKRNMEYRIWSHYYPKHSSSEWHSPNGIHRDGSRVASLCPKHTRLYTQCNIYHVSSSHRHCYFDVCLVNSGAVRYRSAEEIALSEVRRLRIFHENAIYPSFYTDIDIVAARYRLLHNCCCVLCSSLWVYAFRSPAIVYNRFSASRWNRIRAKLQTMNLAACKVYRKPLEVTDFYLHYRSMLDFLRDRRQSLDRLSNNSSFLSLSS